MAKQHNYPLYEVTPIANLRDMLEIADREAGNKIAFKYFLNGEVVSVTYHEFHRDTIALGTAIANLGIHEKHIACIGENSYKWVTAYLAVLNSDNVFIPIDRELPTSDVVNVLNHSDADVVFYSGAYDKPLRENAEKCPRVKLYIGFDIADADADETHISYDKLLAKGYAQFDSGSAAYTSEVVDPSVLKLLVYTSGTTGMAKGVMLSEHNLTSLVYHGLRVSTVFTCCLSVLPYNHTYEAVCDILVSLHMHATICINDKIRNVLKNLQLFKPDYIYLVPAFAESFYKKIWSSAKESGKDGALRKLISVSNNLRKVGIDMRKVLFKSIHDQFGGHLIKIVCGGAPIRPEIGEFFEAIGISLVNGYGITECSPLVSANRDYFNDFRTAGSILPCVEVKIVDKNEDGNGEICVKGDTVMLGYYKNPEETARVLVDGWFYTGDYGYVNEYGQLLITGRKKNLIVLSNGKNVYPEEIENYILSIPYVTEVVVYGGKDETGGEVSLIAEAYLNSDKMKELGITDPVAALKKDVSAACRDLPYYKQVSKIIIRREEFEKTTTQKIKRQAIKHETN